MPKTKRISIAEYVETSDVPTVRHCGVCKMGWTDPDALAQITHGWINLGLREVGIMRWLREVGITYLTTGQINAHFRVGRHHER